MRKLLVLLILPFVLLTVATRGTLHYLLVFLCKYSGRDNYFWAKVMFWIAVILSFMTIGGFLLILFAYIILPSVRGVSFYLPSVAEKFRKSEDSGALPIEAASIPSMLSLHVWSILIWVLFRLVEGVGLLEIVRLAGFLTSYAALHFLLDKQSGGKSLFKRASESLSKLPHKAKEKLGSDDVLPQPI